MLCSPSCYIIATKPLLIFTVKKKVKFLILKNDIIHIKLSWLAFLIKNRNFFVLLISQVPCFNSSFGPFCKSNNALYTFIWSSLGQWWFVATNKTHIVFLNVSFYYCKANISERWWILKGYCWPTFLSSSEIDETRTGSDLENFIIFVNDFWFKLPKLFVRFSFNQNNPIFTSACNIFCTVR